MRWAAERQQTLSRTIRGVMLYGRALRVLARLEGVRRPRIARTHLFAPSNCAPDPGLGPHPQPPP